MVLDWRIVTVLPQSALRLTKLTPYLFFVHGISRPINLDDSPTEFTTPCMGSAVFLALKLFRRPLHSRNFNETPIDKPETIPANCNSSVGTEACLPQCSQDFFYCRNWGNYWFTVFVWLGSPCAKSIVIFYFIQTLKCIHKAGDIHSGSIHSLCNVLG